MVMTLSSPAFDNGETIPPRFTCDGDNLSPALAWSGVPAGTESLLLVCDDPDAPRGTFHHWAAFDIPVAWTGLSEGYGLASGGDDEFRQAVNDFGKPGYGGPCPPRDDEPHGYSFRLYALDAELAGLGAGPSCVEVMRAAAPHVIETAELVGYYGR